MSQLEMVTVNAAGDGNVDNIPGNASTGYQAQNTLSEAVRLGMDTVCIDPISSDTVVVRVGGIVDVNGVLFAVKTEVEFSSIGATELYVVVEPSASPTQKSLWVTNEKPLFDSTKNGFYTSDGKRVLNSRIFREGATISVSSLTQSVKRYGSGSLGVGRGGKRAVFSPGLKTIIVVDSGIYMLSAIGGGQAIANQGSSNESGGNGGTAGRVQLHLSAGDVVVLLSASAGGSSSCAVTGRVNLVCPPSGGASCNVTGDYIEKAVYNGGKSRRLDVGDYDDSEYKIAGVGGGAGPFGAGNDGYGARTGGFTQGSAWDAGIEKIDGVCALGQFGKGNGGSGFSQIEWITD